MDSTPKKLRRMWIIRILGLVLLLIGCVLCSEARDHTSTWVELDTLSEPRQLPSCSIKKSPVAAAPSTPPPLLTPSAPKQVKHAMKGSTPSIWSRLRTDWRFKKSPVAAISDSHPQVKPKRFHPFLTLSASTPYSNNIS